MKYVIETLEIERALVKNVLRSIERNCHEYCDSFTEAFALWNGHLAELEAASFLLANVEKPNAPQHGQPKICPRCKAVLSTESGFNVCDNCGYDGSDVGKLQA